MLSNLPVLSVSSFCGTRVSREIRGLRSNIGSKGVLLLKSVGSGRVHFIHQISEPYSSHLLDHATHSYASILSSTLLDALSYPSPEDDLPD